MWADFAAGPCRVVLAAEYNRAIPLAATEQRLQCFTGALLSVFFWRHRTSILQVLWQGSPSFCGGWLAKPVL